MRSAASDYELVRGRNLQNTLDLLSNGEGWRPIAGGTDLMVLLNAGKLPFLRLVSLRNLDELRRISVSDEAISLGAAVTYSDMQRHPLLNTEFPLLSQAASWTGGVANQNQGTLGGNIANGSPAADSAPPLLVYEAQIHLLSLAGERIVPYADFHLGYKKFAMQPHELLGSIVLPRRTVGRWQDHGRKVGTRRAQAISKVSFAATATSSDGYISRIHLAFASVAPIPLRCRSTEQLLTGAPLAEQTFENARQMLKAEISPIDDIRSTASYRTQVAQNLLCEFLSGLR